MVRRISHQLLCATRRRGRDSARRTKGAAVEQKEEARIFAVDRRVRRYLSGSRDSMNANAFIFMVTYMYGHRDRKADGSQRFTTWNIRRVTSNPKDWESLYLVHSEIESCKAGLGVIYRVHDHLTTLVTVIFYCRPRRKELGKLLPGIEEIITSFNVLFTRDAYSSLSSKTLKLSFSLISPTKGASLQARWLQLPSVSAAVEPFGRSGTLPSGSRNSL